MKTVNELQNIGEEFFKLIREKEAWKEISKNEDIPWDDKLIEKYADKLDWEELCGNNGVDWTIKLIEKHKNKIDWDGLSENIFGRFSAFSHQNTQNKINDWNVIKKYESFWNWSSLSRQHNNLTEGILEQFADNWDWEEIIDNRSIKWTYRLYEKFKQYIPMNNLDHFQRSQLWESIIELEAKILEGKILKEAMND